jgi:hypothetical protein
MSSFSSEIYGSDSFICSLVEVGAEGGQGSEGVGEAVLGCRVASVVVAV